MKSFKLYFTDNKSYDREDLGLPCVSSLAKALTWLYTPEACVSDVEDYNMEENMKLCELVSVVVTMTSKAQGDFGEITLRETLADMRGSEWVKYVKPYRGKSGDTDIVMFNCTSHSVLMAILWGCHVYALVLAHYNPKWKSAATNINKVFFDYSGFTLDEYFDNLLVKHTDKAVKQVIDDAEQKKRGKAGKDTGCYVCKRPRADEPEPAPEDEVTAAQKVRLKLVYELLRASGAQLEKYGNKAKAANLMNTITGIPVSTCARFCTENDMNRDSHRETLDAIRPWLEDLELPFRL